ncbi:PH domain-containing protein [Lysobacter sp. 2RAF19]
MTETARFRVPAFNRASLTTLVVVFASIYGVSAAMLEGSARNGALMVTTALLATILVHMAWSAVSLEADALRVGAGLFRKRILYSEVINVAAEQRPRLGWRLNGIGFPGFALGWFAGSGGRRLFVAAGNGQIPALRVSLRGSFDLVVSVKHPVELERALRSRAMH